MQSIDADIVVIGAGPTGGAATWQLASAGADVLCIDGGEWFDYGDLRRDAADWELRRATSLHSNPNIRKGPFDDAIDDKDTPIKPMIGSGIGGGSIYWSAHVPRFRPEDFRTQTLDGVGEDWPLGYEDLADYYTLNEARWGVAAIPNDPSVPAFSNGRLRLPTVGAHGRRIANALNTLGWHWWPVDLVVGRDGDEDGAVHCTHIGPCDLGCPSRIRSGADRAFIRPALAAGARVMPRTKALHFEHDREGAITAVICQTDDGQRRVTGRRFILCANGIGTPHLLLLSQSGKFTEGLANSSGMVGRNLMLHPYARIDGLFDTPVGAMVAGEKAGLVSFEFFQTRPEHDFKRGLKLQLTGGPAAGALAKGAVVGAPLPWGIAHHAAFETTYDHICGFTVCAEDLADPDNRITLSSELKTRQGLPAAKMTYRVSENSRKILDFGLDRAEEVLREAGARRTFRTPLRSEAGFHLMGTARMGNDPSRSVVDRFGRCHDHHNLFIADASVFVTASSINPTATAQALALRTADHVLATRRS